MDELLSDLSSGLVYHRACVITAAMNGMSSARSTSIKIIISHCAPPNARWINMVEAWFVAL